MFGLSDNESKNNLAAPQAGSANPPSTATPAYAPIANELSGSSLPPTSSGIPAVSSPPAISQLNKKPVLSIAGNPPGISNLSASDTGLGNAYPPAGPKPVTSFGSVASTPAKPPAASPLSGSGVSEDELIKVKQQALQNLTPLVDHLEQTPEEKFRTTMMLIQASDNAELIHDAYDSANKITDEKKRAQALLDVVNEINYFTQHGVNVPNKSSGPA